MYAMSQLQGPQAETFPQAMATSAAARVDPSPASPPEASDRLAAALEWALVRASARIQLIQDSELKKAA